MTDFRAIEIPVEPFTAAAFAPFGALVAQPGRAADFAAIAATAGVCRSRPWARPS